MRLCPEKEDEMLPSGYSATCVLEIIYLDNYLLLAAPTKDQLLMDLSTDIWLLIQSGIPNKYPEVHHSPHLSSEVSGVHSGHREHGNLSRHMPN